MSIAEEKPNQPENQQQPQPNPDTAQRPNSGGRSAKEVWISEAKIVPVE